MTHNSALRDKIRAKYPVFTRKPSSNAVLVQPQTAGPRETFKLPGSARLYYAHRNRDGKYAGIRRVGGRPKVGRNAPGYRAKARARGKLIASGL